MIMVNYYLYERNAEISFVLDLLKEFDSYFIPNISVRQNIVNYSEKLAINAHIIVAKDDMKNIGFSAFYFNKSPKDTYLTLLAVNHDYQKLGIGSKLIDIMINFCKKNHSPGIMLEMRADDSKLFNFYTKLGFKIAETFKSPYNNEEKYYLRKNLTDE